MIAKRIRRTNNSCFKRLCEYIRDLKNDGLKVDHEWQTNCISDKIQLATKEIKINQQFNTRSRIDKTYHLIFAFRNGEKPKLEDLKRIEDHLCEAIGLGEHQRVCVAHNDTDNYHVHLAISKIHPKTFNCIEPFYDKKKLQKACIEIEKKFGLEAIPGRGENKSKISEVEAKSGLESFKGWIKRNLSVEIKNYLKQDNANWEGLQTKLMENGLTLRKHGAGLVFSHNKNKLFVKASSVDRSFSIKKIEEKLGAFKDVTQSKIEPKKEYTKQPIHNSSQLWEEYSGIQAKMKRNKEHRLKVLREKKKNMYSKIQNESREKRRKIKLDAYMSKSQKRAMYSKIKAESLEKKNLVTTEIAKIRSDIFEKNKAKPWIVYLVDKAKNGDKEALKTLRKKGDSIKIPNTNVLYTSFTYKEISWNRAVDHITREGHVRYKVPGGLISDEGGRITLGKMPSKEAVTIALNLALEKFGRNLKIDGTDEFKKLATEIMKKDRKFFNLQKGIER